MNKIVKEHVPVEALPADVRRQLANYTHVTMEVVAEEPANRQARTLEELFDLVPEEERLTDEQVARRVRSARDGWDEEAQ